MVLADIISIFLVVLGILIATNTIWLLNRAIWPKAVKLAGEIVCESAWKSFFLGLLILVGNLVVVTVLSKLGKGLNELLSLVVLSSFFWFASIGVAGFAAIIGESLELGANKVWKQTCFGGIVLEFSFLLPVFGWFVLFPALTIIGSGASLRALLRLRKTAKAEVAQPQSMAQSESTNLSESIQ